ncbi:MAG: response regulator transcription factor [Gammaproteobacteria bacterium]|nr:response regulator transcription factor [Gammaproteobacteria bacterium]
MNKEKILILEDDVLALDEAAEAISDEGFCVVKARSEQEFKTITKRHTLDLLLIDVNLPDGNGLSLARKIRMDSGVGIIIVSGKKIDEADRVIGLGFGADDYITKPYGPRELLARIHAVLRRTKGSQYPELKSNAAGIDIIEFLNWRLDLGAQQLSTPGGENIHLTTAEYKLLKVFLERPNRVLSREYLIEEVHDREWTVYDRGMDGLVSRLRRKIPLPGNIPPLIKTIRGAGYLFPHSVNR